MRSRIGALMLAWVAVSPETSAAQASIDDFGFLLGEWQGVLEYLDYQDDETWVQLETVMRCTPNDDGSSLILSYTYGEPDGRRVDGREVLRLTDTPGELLFDGRWRVVEASLDPTAKLYEVVLERDGSDNERPATLRKTIWSDGSALTITKQVRYEGTDGYFERNRHRFSRVDEP